MLSIRQLCVYNMRAIICCASLLTPVYVRSFQQGLNVWSTSAHNAGPQTQDAASAHL